MFTLSWTGWLEKYCGVSKTVKDEEDIDFWASSKIEGNTICPLGDAVSWPVAQLFVISRDEFEYHVRSENKKQKPLVLWYT
jgi:NADH-quinone oxidoreductase subunit F